MPPRNDGRINRELLALVYETMAQGVVFLSPDGIINSNAAAQEILGRSAEELHGSRIRNLKLDPVRTDGSPFPPEDFPGEVALRTGRPVDDVIVGIFNPVEQRRRWLLFSSRPLEMDGDSPAIAFSTFTDITEQRNAQARLRESEKRYRLLARNLPRGGVVLIDRDLRYVLAEGPGLESAGFSSNALEGKTIYDALPAETVKLIEPLAQAALHGESTKFEIPYGELIFVVDAVPIYDEHGSIEMALFIFENVTAEREMENELRQAQKMEAIGRIAGGLAHDFNNVLTAISGHAALVLDQLHIEDPLRDDVREVLKSADRASALTRHLLAFSRKQVLQPRVLDLCTVASDMQKMLVRVIGEDVALSLSADTPGPRVHADRGQLEQVIVNLVLNARDALPDRGGAITITVRDEGECTGHSATGEAIPRKPYASLSVSDNGSGISPAVLPRIFDPFFTTKEHGKGTGLGLSSVYGVVTQSGGYITVRTYEGEGTTFTVLLPLVQAEPQTSDAHTHMDRDGAGKETVLLVEDDAAVRALVARVLRRNGYTVYDCASGDDALRVVEEKQRKIDVLLTDVVMPGMTGPEVASRVQEKIPGVKVLFASGYSDDMIARYGAGEAKAHLIEKPFTPNVLVRKLREVLDERN